MSRLVVVGSLFIASAAFAAAPGPAPRATAARGVKLKLDTPQMRGSVISAIRKLEPHARIHPTVGIEFKMGKGGRGSSTNHAVAHVDVMAGDAFFKQTVSLKKAATGWKITRVR